MKLIQWSFQNIAMPMLEDDHGDLYTTTTVLCRALQTTKQRLTDIVRKHPTEFSELRYVETVPKELLVQFQQELGIERMRKDLRLWTESDMILFAILSRSPVSRDFRQNLVQFIKNNARRGYVSREEHDNLSLRLSKLEKIFELAKPALESSGAAAGAALQAHRGLKSLKTYN